MNVELETPVWVPRRVADARPGALRLARERVSLTLGDGVRVFEVPVREARHRSRWYWFDTVFDLVTADASYRILLSPAFADGAAIGAARTAGKAWKTALEPLEG
jgi:hypothetical protein